MGFWGVRLKASGVAGLGLGWGFRLKVKVFGCKVYLRLDV